MAELNRDYLNASLSVEERIAILLPQMTLEEKVGQLNQVHTRPQNTEKIKELTREGKVGSRILASSHQAGSEEQVTASLAESNEAQRIAVEESRLGIPVINGRDIIHGHRTIFPIPIATAASFDPETAEQCAAVAAKEAASLGVHWTFAPMVDVARDPRWGRIIEGGGEDPYLTSAMGAAAVRGFQGQTRDEMKQPDKIAACGKHFAGYGAAEGGRDYNTTEISVNSLRNVYLPPFRACVEAGVSTFMSGFHQLNGESVSGSHFLLTEILREEWGFDGYVISDWASVDHLINHRIAHDKKEAAQIAFHAGVDMDMCSNCFDHLVDLVREGAIDESRLHQAVSGILRVKFYLGLFENPYTDESLADRVNRLPAHLELAKKAALGGMVLLKNEAQNLPIDKKQEGLTFAVVGPYAEDRRNLLGSWTMDGKADETESIADAIKSAAPDADVRVASHPGQAVRTARMGEVDHIICVVGEHFTTNGENGSVSDIRLLDGQEDLVRDLATIGKPLTLVVCAGRPLALTNVEPLVDSILYAWQSGNATGAAVAELLFGDAVPSGKLPATFPRATGQIPIHYNHKNRGWQYDGAGIYTDLSEKPLYPFGYGLSYTSFAYSDIAVSDTRINRGGTITVSATVTNTGQRDGIEVAQCYIQDCVSSAARPVRELKGFERVTLAPGESKTVRFELTDRELGFFNVPGRWTVEPGEFKVWVGTDSTAGLETGFRIEA